MTDTSPDVVEIRRGNQAVTALDWGGDGPAVVLLHPNGFCGGLYEPIAHALRRTCRPVAIDLRGHGATHAPADPELYHFVHLADDLIAGEPGCLAQMAEEHARHGGSALDYTVNCRVGFPHLNARSGEAPHWQAVS